MYSTSTGMANPKWGFKPKIRYDENGNVDYPIKSYIMTNHRNVKSLK